MIWWLLTHRLDRFWLPMLRPLAVLAGLGADWSGRGVVVIAGCVMALVGAANPVYARPRWPA